MSRDVIELYEKAAVLNYAAKYRTGNIINLPTNGRVVVSGDLHGHRRNFERIVTFADLEHNCDTHLVLQEIIHGGPEDDFGGCLSFDLLYDVLRFRIRFPEQVHIILANHDTAFISNNNVMKAGKEMNQAMRAAMQRRYSIAYDDIECALKQYLISQPLAVRCPNRIWISHSLPDNRFLSSFDPEILSRKLRIADMERPRSAYLLTWGRRHSQDTLNKCAELFDVDIFIVGHQPVDTGWTRAGENLIILASDHNHGAIISYDLDKTYNMDELTGCITPLAAIE